MASTDFDDPGDPIPSCDTFEEQMDAVMERFKSVAEEAQKLGITSAIQICSFDPLDRKTHWQYLERGSRFEVIGLMSAVLDVLKSD